MLIFLTANMRRYNKNFFSPFPQRYLGKQRKHAEVTPTAVDAWRLQYAAAEEPACILRQSCWQSLNEQIDLRRRGAALRWETSSISGQNCFLWRVACEIYTPSPAAEWAVTLSLMQTCVPSTGSLILGNVLPKQKKLLLVTKISLRLEFWILKPELIKTIKCS